MKHLIIGGGPAALSAAATLRKAAPGDNVTILCRESGKPYSRMALPHLLAGRIEKKNFFVSLPSGVEYCPGEDVAGIAPEKREVKTAAGKTFNYDRLLIASGAAPEKPLIEGGDLPFVFTIRHLPDIEGIRSRLKGGKGHALIAGAGPVGIEMGDALHELGVSLTFVVSSDRIFSSMLDAAASEKVAVKMREAGVEILTGDEMTAIAENGKVSLKSGGSRKCDIVIIGKGVKPAVSFLKGSGIAVGRGIVVDERQATNKPDIYAAGDTAEGWDLVYGERRVNALLPVAVEQGRVAALNMAGIPSGYRGSIGRNILSAFGFSVSAAGAGAEQGYDIRVMEGSDYYRKIVLYGGLLKGFIFVGDTRNDGLYSSLIGMKTDVSAFAGSILKGSYGYSRHLARACRMPR